MVETLLIIDDFEPVRKTVKRIAEREKFVTLLACDGREGLEVFSKEHPDIVITDLKMPNIDGKGVLCAIKEQSPKTEVIVLTGYGDADTASYLLRQGAFSYLQKPLDLEQLIKVLTSARERVRQGKPAEQQAPETPTQVVPLQIEFAGAKEIHVRWGPSNDQEARQSLRLFADGLPFPLMVLRQSLGIVYTNAVYGTVFGPPPSLLSAPVIDAMAARGLKVPPFEELRQNLNTLFTSPNPVIETSRMENYLSLGLFKATVKAGSAPAEDMLVVALPAAGSGI